MKVLAVVGPPGSDRTSLVERLVERLDERGAVGTVTRGTDDFNLEVDGRPRQRDTGATQSYAIADGEWVGTGESLTLDEALDRLAQSCTYTLVEGYRNVDLPKVVLGDEESEHGTVIARASSADVVDVDAVVDTLADVEPYETLSSLVARAKQSPDADKAGAIATFTGRVREKEDDDDTPTEFLEFEKYDGVAQEKTAAIREELESRDGVYEVLLHHRTGVVEAGEDIVFVVVLAGHRPEAFRTVEDGIDRLKEEVPIFKKEVTVSEEFWAHEQ